MGCGLRISATKRHTTGKNSRTLNGASRLEDAEDLVSTTAAEVELDKAHICTGRQSIPTDPKIAPWHKLLPMLEPLRLQSRLCEGLQSVRCCRTPRTKHPTKLPRTFPDWEKLVAGSLCTLRLVADHRVEHGNAVAGYRSERREALQAPLASRACPRNILIDLETSSTIHG
jgi:hypothetical protein